MASTILQTQADSKRFLSIPSKVDNFFVGPSATVPAASTVKRWVQQPSADMTIAFNSTVGINLPLEGHIIDVCLQMNLGALSSGNYCKYPGMALITQVQLLHGSEVLHQYDYREVMSACLSLLNNSEKDTVLKAAGGTSFASGNCTVPIPLFFNRWMSKKNIPMPAFPAHKLKSKLKLKLTLDTAANVAASGSTAGTPTITGNFILTYGYTEFAGEDFPYLSYDPESKIGTTIATATATDVICDGVVGNIAHIVPIIKKVSDYTTAHDYFQNYDCDVIKLQVNSDKQYFESDESTTGLLDQLTLGMGEGLYTTLTSVPYFIPIASRWNPRAFLGAINMKNVEQLRVNLNQSQGVNCYGQVVAFKSTEYVIENGMVKRRQY